MDVIVICVVCSSLWLEMMVVGKVVGRHGFDAVGCSW